MKIKTAAILLLTGISLLRAKEPETLRNTINDIVRHSRGVTGVAVAAVDDPSMISVNDSLRFPMQSVFKFHLALAVLHEVDRGTLRLDDTVRIRKEDLFPTTWSPMRDRHPGGEFSQPLSEIIRATVSMSDNIGCDVLFRLVGGPASVHRYIRSLGIDSVSIVATEAEMHRAWNIQFSNWSTPSAAVRLLNKLYAGKILSKESTSYLLKIMTETSTGPKRLKGLLPSGTPVAHKTGTSGRSNDGLTAAVNDIGIITLPNGRSVAVAVFVSQTPDDDAASEKVIATIARAVWDYYSDEQ